jgi:TonB family protein
MGEVREEPRLLADPEAPARPLLSPVAPPLADDVAGRREPGPPTEAAAAPRADREAPVGSGGRSRPYGPIGSLVLHLLPLLLVLDWPLRPPPEAPAIPVRLVFQPPPPPAPAKPSPPKPLPKPEVRPPPGRLASEDIGDTTSRGQDREKSEAAAAGEKPSAEQAPPSSPEQKTAAVIPPPPLPGAAGLPEEKPGPEPPRPKPKPAIHPPALRRTAARLHFNPRPARVPGPAATRDEYLAYLAYLTRKHLNLLPMSMVGGRRGQTVLDILVLDNGSLGRVSVGRSSGYPDIDRRVEAMIEAVGHFPPLPQWFQGPAMQLEFRLTFPEALEN